MSAAPSTPTPSPLPVRPAPPSSSRPTTTSTTRPHPKPAFPTPKLLFQTNDLTHPGASVFFSACNPALALSSAVTTVLSSLYHPTPTNTHIPPTRSVTLVLRAMKGVAYTTGKDFDDDHKEIHFSLNYIAQIPAALQRAEIMGVLVHEMVHCWQWAALSTAPGGLIEGIADFVRLKAGLDPPHWKKEAGGDWDAGYQHTGYFLEWVEERFGEGSVERVNAGLKGKKYVEGEFWNGLFGKGVGELWREYGRTLEPEGGDRKKGQEKQEGLKEQAGKERKDGEEKQDRKDKREGKEKQERKDAVEVMDDECVLVEREDEAREVEGKKGEKNEDREQVKAEVKRDAKEEAEGSDAGKAEVNKADDKDTKPPSYLV